MNKIIIILILSLLKISFGIAKQIESEAAILPKKINDVMKTSFSKDKDKAKPDFLQAINKKINQIDIPDLEIIVKEVSKKYRAQLQKPSDKNSFLKALENAQEEIVNKYLKKHAV